MQLALGIERLVEIMSPTYESFEREKTETAKQEMTIGWLGFSQKFKKINKTGKFQIHYTHEMTCQWCCLV